MKKGSSSSRTRKSRSTSSRPSSRKGVRSIPKIELQKDLAEFVEWCLLRKVEFLVVGGYAMALHGFPRFSRENFEEGPVMG